MSPTSPVSPADEGDTRIAAWVEEQARNAPQLSEEQLETLHDLLSL